MISNWVATVAVVTVLLLGSHHRAESQEPTLTLTLATATAGGGFEVFGREAASAMSAADPGLALKTLATDGSTDNIGRLERGEVDLALVAGIPAYEAIYGVGRPKASLSIIAALYASPGLFAVRSDTPARSFRDMVGKRVAWGTRASGLTATGIAIATGLGLDPERDFQARYVEKAGEGPALVLSGEVDGFWGGGSGWPGFVKITESGGRLVGLADEEIATVVAKRPFLKPMTLPAGSYPGQSQPIRSVGAWAYIVSRSDLPEASAYRAAAALAAAQPRLAEKLPQAVETTPENTARAAPSRGDLHPGVERFLRERGL
ncbi:MAG: TAXI family TRAP transporter solute-binding subunit [Hyphomicrobiaceae bacterium]|nr:TAXI family TRAP transporter solute-binding subunit [Hyphomicrobiaceae bacterium]